MSTTATKANRVANVIIPVADQDAQIDFYVERLGLSKRVDLPFGEHSRWVEVAPDGAETTIALAPPPEGVETGGRQTGITLQTDDIQSYHAALKEAGVDVDEEVSIMGDPVPPMFWFRDPEGNTLLVVQ